MQTKEIRIFFLKLCSKQQFKVPNSFVNDVNENENVKKKKTERKEKKRKEIYEKFYSTSLEVFRSVSPSKR